MKANDGKRLKKLEAENARLKKLVPAMAIDIDMLREVAERNYARHVTSAFHDGRSPAGSCLVPK